ncbi:ferredoxin [Pseudonocardia sp.]|jgi:ferredoxin|uniref:ferredoxin n=1 Tax=Pseudonocardia sp. TaxID=60912 RepID=UPI003D11E824
MRVHVNRELCRGHGVCAGNAPEVFLFDDEDRAYAEYDVVPAGLEEVARSAVYSCPEHAIEMDLST